jgi:hypothetical protein
MTLATGRDWVGADLQHEAWRLAMTGPAAAALVAAVREGVRAPADVRSLEPLRPLIDELRRRLALGHGFAVVQDFPVDALDEDELGRACHLLGLCLGRPVSQDRSGATIARVEDAGARLDVPTQRGYQSGAALPFHVDRTDVVGLLCVRAADAGGESRVVSAAAVERMLGETVPEALAELQAPLPQDRRGEEQPGERPWAATPVFCDGGVTRYGRRFIETSQRFPDAPRLRPEQWDALDAVDAVLATPGVALEHRLERGELQLLDNYATWHGRAAFGDGNARRLLLRLWLATAQSPELPALFRPLYGATDAGSVRGGVWPIGGYPSDFGQPVQPLL